MRNVKKQQTLRVLQNQPTARSGDFTPTTSSISRKRRRCVALSKGTQTKIGSTHGLMSDAANALCLLKTECSRVKEKRKFGFQCLVCKKYISLTQDVNYDWRKPFGADTTSGRYLKRVCRRHCLNEHPKTPLWNVVYNSETKYSAEMNDQPFSIFIHQAMKAGCIMGAVPVNSNRNEFTIAFKCRILSSICWIKWSQRAWDRLQQFVQDKDKQQQVRSDVILELEKVEKIGCKKINSDAFAEVAKNHSTESLFNELMLFFCDLGRYRKCQIFGTG